VLAWDSRQSVVARASEERRQWTAQSIPKEARGAVEDRCSFSVAAGDGCHGQALQADDRPPDMPHLSVEAQALAIEIDGPGDVALLVHHAGEVCKRLSLHGTFSESASHRQCLTKERDRARIVALLTRNLDPAALGPQPAHTYLERFLPLAALLPRCSLVLFHGGSGTLGRAVAHGLPMVILPLSADQPDNAARYAELGASRTVEPDELTPERISDVVLDVLHTPGYRQSAERLLDAFNALPGPELPVELLERLARQTAPVIAPV
jgi:hypothetical protein